MKKSMNFVTVNPLHNKVNPFTSDECYQVTSIIIYLDPVPNAVTMAGPIPTMKTYGFFRVNA